MEKKLILKYVILPSVFAFLGWHFFISDDTNLLCIKDYDKIGVQCRPHCDLGEFSLPWMGTCRKWLSCKEIVKDVKIVEALGSGAVKVAYLAKWHGYDVVLNTLINKKYQDDFTHGIKMIKNLQPNPKVIQLLGNCKDIYVTEYHRFKSADHFEELLEEYPYHNTLRTRFNLCRNYVEIIDFLHNSPIGTRVMCDSNDIDKTLNQYLIRSNFSLIVNDLDALPKVSRAEGKLIKCGPREIVGDFVAPEQLWPFDDKDFKNEEMPAYDEKTDIWKIPDICEHFVGNDKGGDSLKFHLFNIHKRCKNKNPTERPTAIEILEEYEKIKEKLNL